ncbi:elongation factor P 5-aminopentanone reductase [Peribacillus sp. B-H-3]|uniref:elongation factor P 5-aminopentanone reductase n=1 Tax=Peribacillus sp. B-H-3 TaxID=3400420 RepID=UPI003B02C3D8
MEKRFVLVTGASGGIGRAISTKLAHEGYSLYLHYNKNRQGAEQLAKELHHLDIELIPVQADLGEPNGYKILAQNIFSLHSVVLNSGMSHYGLISEADHETVRQMVQLNITSPYELTRELLPKLFNQESASIVAITSIWGQTGASCEALYSMVKGGQNAFVKALSKELSLNGIRVNAVAPGAISTSMMETFSLDELESIKERVPMGRIGLPDEVAEAVSFLLSQKASYITGQILGVNGGWYT